MKNSVLNRKEFVSIIFGLFYSAVFVIGRSIYNTNGLVSLYSTSVNVLKTVVLFVVVLLFSTFVFYLIIKFVEKYKIDNKVLKIRDKKL